MIVCREGFGLLFLCSIGVFGFETQWNKNIYSRPLKPSYPSWVDGSSRASPPKDVQHEGCGETRVRLNNGDHGIIQSPGYPNNYESGLDCEYRYESAPGTYIIATVFDMRTQNALLSDISDSLYLSLNGNWSNSQRFSGDLNGITPMTFVSDANALSVRFKSSPFTTGNRGFRMGYYVRGSSTGKPAASEPAHDVWTVVWCNYSPVDHPQIFPEMGISRDARAEVAERTNPNPFLVAMILDDEQFCSGTLISDRHVVTSAHCTRGVRQIQMIFGTENLAIADSGVQKRTANASAVTEHPYFDQYSGANDISIIELVNPVELTKYVAPAALPSWSYLATSFAGYKGEVVGWGDVKTGTIYTQAGNKTVHVVPNNICSSSNRNSNGQTMCSSSVRGPTCQADSGSPIITRGAACNGPVDQTNNGDNGINNSAQKPPRPQKPVQPVKPNKPGKPRPRNVVRYQTNALLGIVSYGSCDQGFSFTRITAYLDFINRFITVGSDV